MNCTEFREIVDSYLSDELLTETNHTMMRHVETCSDCQNLIAARKEIRSRLKSAVVSSEEYVLPEGFDHKLMTRIRTEGHQTESSRSWIGLGAFATTFAAFALVAAFGFGYLGGSEGQSSSYLVSGFSADALLNVASGDHEHCAIRHDLEELPVALKDADPQYRGLDKVVEKEASSVLAGHRLSEAHYCKYKDTKFAHIVMRKDDKAVSFLVAANQGEKHDEIVDFETQKYRISAFTAGAENVYVISNHDRGTNRKTAEAVNAKLVERLSVPTGTETAQLFYTPLGTTASLMSFQK